MSKKSDTKSRKYQLTFNNPLEYGCTHDMLNDTMKNFNYSYYCLCDEIGAEEKTPHTHLYFVCENAIRFSKVKKLFPSSHIETARGSSQDNRDYIRKEGKYLNSEKKETNLIDTFEEYGILPLDKAEKNLNVSTQVLEMIDSGFSNNEIIHKFPSYINKIPQLNQTRETIKFDEYKNVWRDIEIIYISGETNTGKTRSVMEQYGYENVCKITNYKNPFDNYNGQEVILFDEFRSSLPISDMLQYIDGYPCSLPCRYADKVACFTKVYIISNIDLNEQYPNVQISEPKTWNAFIRRINKVLKFVNSEDLPFPSDDKTCKIELLPSDFIKEV